MVSRNLLQSLGPVVHSRTEDDQEHDRQSDHPLEFVPPRSPEESSAARTASSFPGSDRPPPQNLNADDPAPRLRPSPTPVSTPAFSLVSCSRCSSRGPF